MFLAGTVALYIAAYAYGRTAADRSFDRLLAGSARSIADTLVEVDGDIDVSVPYSAIDMLSVAPNDRVFYRVYGSDGKVVTGYPYLPSAKPWAGMQRDTRRQDVHFFNAQYSGETVRFAIIRREIAKPGNLGSVWVQIGQTTLAREALTHELALRSLLPIIFMTVAALGLNLLAIGRALQPLKKISEDLARRDPSALHPITAPVPSEVAPLVNGINFFMLRLEHNIQMLKAFVAEAAHQMRTPLAAMRAQAQIAVDDAPAGVRHSLEAIDRNASKLARLLNQMLSNATVSHRGDVRRFERFDLLATVHEAVHEVVPRADAKRLTVYTELTETPIHGDPLMLLEALKNIVDNALQHGAPDSSSIEIHIDKEGPHYLVSISDRGPGIPTCDQEKVFERFFRRGSKASGAGLGLAIVKQVIESHGGTVQLLNRAGGGLIVLLRIPQGAE